MANIPQLGAPGGDDDSQEMPTCKHCGQAIFFEHAADCPVVTTMNQLTTSRSPEFEAGRQLARELVRAERQRDDLLAVLKHITDRAGKRSILTLSTVDIATMRDAIANVERGE